MAMYEEGRRAAKLAKAEAESELTEAQVKDIALQIEAPNSKVKAQTRDMERPKKSITFEEKHFTVGSVESHQSVAVLRELERVKEELSKIKLDMASVVEQKRWAEKEMEGSSSKLSSDLSSLESLRKEIEKVNEEQVLVELARIEAWKEYREIKARRENEAGEFLSRMAETKKRTKDAMEEIDNSKEAESKLAVTLCDVNVLQNELKHAKELEKKLQRVGSLKRGQGNFRKRREELVGSPLLSSITEELDAAKRELASIREEGFQLMASMDVTRDELKHVAEGTDILKKAEEKADAAFQNLNSKLLKEKSKLEAATAADKKAHSIISNLSLTLEQLKAEAEVAKNEKELTDEETANIRAEIQKTKSETELTEERLQAAMQELEAVKLSEDLALEKLQEIVENAVRARASASQHGSTITISKLEYDYLTGRAAGAEETADKKVAAAQAWIEALNASEKEILMKIEIARREDREMRVEEEQEVHKTVKSLSAKGVVEGELRNWKQNCERRSTGGENKQHKRNSSKGSSSLTPSRGMKIRTSVISPARASPRSIFTAKKKKKKDVNAMPKLAKMFYNKKIDKDDEVSQLL
uniref:Protein PLASTID MOVEMENT IMPAIRED 2 n=1 Tax=Rhizophora mucronata TaxID=61149 RepID=A0A2P2Q3V5_RHIMU